MSMFLSKLLNGRSNSKSKLELLTEAWTSIQKYYETAADPLKDAVEGTPIPCCLQNIVKLIQAEELEYQRASDSLETGPCLEYLLHKRVLEELVEFAKVDTPFGMRIQCLRFFCSLVNNVHAQLLPERAVHVPLQKLIHSCHRLIAHHYEQLVTDPDSCPEERHAAISELSLELVKLMHGVFSHFKGTNAALMDLFFERGWCRGLGENVWRSSKDGKTFHKRRESMDDKIAWNMFLTPRFDMFTYLIDYMNIPGETGEIAREAVLFALRLLEGDPEYVCYVVEYSGLCEVMAERLALFFARLPKNAGAFTISSNNRVVPVRPPKKRIHLSVPAMITNNTLMITVNAHHSFKKKRRKRSPFDIHLARSLESMQDGEHIVDEFYSFWEYLNDVARVADRRLMTALMAQLTAIFWHPVVCTALSSPSAELATAATAYTTEMIRSLTDQKLLHAFLVVLLGEEGGVGKDLEPEIRSTQPRNDLIDDDRDDDSLKTEDEEDDNKEKEKEKEKVKVVDNDDEEVSLRVLLINRIDAEYHDLSLSTLRFFDTVLETYNQFAIYNLVLRNYLDITPDGEYLEDVEKNDENKDTTDTSSVGSKAVDDRSSVNDSTAKYEKEKVSVEEPAGTEKDKEKENEESEKKDNKTEKASVEECADTEKDKEKENEESEKERKDNKTEKVRWLVERILSLLPLEDELERMKSPPLSSVIPSDSFASSVHGANANGSSGESQRGNGQSQKGNVGENGSLHHVVIPGNSYDDYFHEARERFQYGLLARNFWRFPYPPPKTKKDYARETEHRRGRLQRRPMSMIVSSKDAELHRGFDRDEEAKRRLYGSYEGLFMSRIFDQFFKMLESSMEQNLLVTSILQKIVGVVDKRVDGVICEWRAIRVGGDGALYGGVWTLPSGKGNRRTLYSLLEQVTFEALKRAQLVPNFETRISLAKKRGILANTSGQNQQHPHAKRSNSVFSLTPSAPAPRGPSKSMPRHPSLSQLVFSRGMSASVSAASPTSPLSPGSPTGTKSTGILPLRGSRETHNSHREKQTGNTLQNGTGNNGNISPNGTTDGMSNGATSSSSSFFQQSQRSNTTPITMTNPFAKLSNFVNSYIVLQEFCKELAAVILVRHATDYSDTDLVKLHDYGSKRESMRGLAHDFWFEDHHYQDIDSETIDGEKPSIDKWKNRISMVSSLTDWRSVRSLDIIDEAITSRVRSISTDAKW